MLVTTCKFFCANKIQTVCVQYSDCNPGIEFSIATSGIEKFVISGSRDSRFGIRLTEWSLF